jgi:Lipoprotein LpqB beta-propeller domain/Sporulation and spore germination
MITSHRWRPAPVTKAWRWRASHRQRTVASVLAAGLAGAMALAGCASVPGGGPVVPVSAGQSGVSQPQDYSQPIPVGPGTGWNPTEIVNGFLAASASFADNHAVARQYLDAAAQRSWHPGWAVTVVNTPTVTNVPPTYRQFAQQPGAGEKSVEVTGQPVATLNAAGQYLVSSGTTESFNFDLIQVNGQWRIDRLPPGTPLLLNQADFEHVYQPRDLYFLAPSGQTLVPDSVFVPQEATDTELATGLVNALLQGPAGWLSGAAQTAFPAHSLEIGQVKIIGTNTIVNLGGSAATASRPRQQQMAAQLAWTLASEPTSSVELEIDGHPQQFGGSAFQMQQMYRNWMPAQSAGSSLYLVGSNKAPETLSGGGPAGRVDAPGLPALSDIAVSPDGRSVAGISTDEDTVYTSSLAGGGASREWHSTSGPCTSLSWDAQGDLWIAAGGNLWMLPPGTSNAEYVELDKWPENANDVVGFRVAPDGVRAAMIVQGQFGGKPGFQVQLAAITRSAEQPVIGPSVAVGGDISDPEQVSWFGPDDVIVLSKGSDGAQLDEVPLNGGPLQPISTSSETESVTATNPVSSGSYIAVGLSDGQIMVSTDLGAFQTVRASGSAPAYPG